MIKKLHRCVPSLLRCLFYRRLPMLQIGAWVNIPPKMALEIRGELQDTVAARLPRPLSVSVMFSEVREMEIQGRLRRTAAPLRF